MRGVEPEVVLALANLANFANLGGGLAVHSLAPQRASELEEERKRISRELHDGIAQELQAVVMHLRLALADQTPASACVATRTALAISERGLAMTRSLLADLHGHARAGMLPSESLARALNDTLYDATRYSPIEICLDVDEKLRISHPVYAELTRMVREIAINALKHGEASSITCMVQRCGESLCLLTVRDDGVGFDLAVTPEGCGLRGLKERAARIGATVLLKSEKGRGTSVTLSIPTV